MLVCCISRGFESRDRQESYLFIVWSLCCNHSFKKNMYPGRSLSVCADRNTLCVLRETLHQNAKWTLERLKNRENSPSDSDTSIANRVPKEQSIWDSKRS